MSGDEEILSTGGDITQVVRPPPLLPLPLMILLLPLPPLLLPLLLLLLIPILPLLLLLQKPLGTLSFGFITIIF